MSEDARLAFNAFERLARLAVLYARPDLVELLSRTIEEERAALGEAVRRGEKTH